MSMTIGRAAITDDPYGDSVRISGNTISFDSTIIGADVNETKARMAQLAGLVDNPDEEVIPFTWTEDPSFDGYYKVRSLSIAPVSVYLATGWCPFSITLERIDDFSYPQFETITRLVTRTNSHGVTIPSTIAVGHTVGDNIPSGVGSVFTNQYFVTTEIGQATIYAASAPLATFSSRFGVLPATWYNGFAKIEAKSGANYYGLTGQQVPSWVGDNWRIGNGWVRAWPALDGRLWVESYVPGTGWVGWKIDMVLSGALVAGGYFGTNAPSYPIRITRNTPEACSIRWNGQAGPMDLTVRAGDPYVELSIAEANPAGNNWGIGLVTPGAGTSGVGFIRANTAISGRTFQVSCASTLSFDTVNTRAWLTAPATTATFAISPDATGAGAAVAWTGLNQRDIFLGYRTQRLKAVRR